MLPFQTRPTRYLFFTGKGGVGKTSLACATAVSLADRGRRVLLVSTDPASNLSEVLGTDVADQVTPIAGVPNLLAMNIDPEAEAAAYRERTVAPMRGVLPDDAIRQVEEQLSGACTMEIAAFDEFTALLTNGRQTGEYDHVIFDTAPTGHTLRLLQLPAAWSGFLDTNSSGASCLGPLSGLEAQRRQYAEAVGILSNPETTTLVLVARAEPSALREADRTRDELGRLGIHNQRLVINGRFHATVRDDVLAAALEARADEALDNMPVELADLPRDEVPLLGHNLVGVTALRALAEGKLAETASHDVESWSPDLPSLGELVDDLVAPGHGLVLVMGKGGVGKTSIAAAIAVEMARRDIPVHLSTTDPAAHLTATLPEEMPHLTVSRIDPAAETQAYTDHVLETRGKDLDEAGRELLREDLRSPCTEEVAVFHAFSKLVREARRGFVVLDTAPTGHTLLLLDAAGSYHREILRTMSSAASRVTTPMMLLQNPEYTRVLIVTLPETTPVIEAARLQADLRRAEIEPFAWVINSSLAAADTADPILLRRAQSERPQIETVQSELAQRACIVPWLTEPPVGPAGLQRLLGESQSGQILSNM
jgi:arsenite/tail-anchored protein-transporting ATPase